MKKLTKSFILLLVLCLTVSVFSACNGKSNENNKTSESSGNSECDHKSVTDIAIKATCTQKGKTEGSHCEKCGEILTAQEEIPEKGHDLEYGICKICSFKKVSEGLEFEYDLLEEGYCVTGIGTCTDQHIIIPETYNEKSVVGIDKQAFYQCNSIISVYIPSSITTISTEAFSNCEKLESVQISSSVVTIRKSAFSDCTSLESVIFFDSSEKYLCPMVVTREFMENEILKYIENSNDSKRLYPSLYVLYDSLSGNLSQEILDKWIEKYPVLKEKEIYVLNVMASGAEKNEIERIIKKWCSHITLEMIEEQHSITGYEGEGLLKKHESIGDAVFNNCTSLKSINISASIRYMGEGVFSGCTNLTDINCEGTEQPDGWDADWNKDCSATVHWGSSN